MPLHGDSPLERKGPSLPAGQKLSRGGRSDPLNDVDVLRITKLTLNQTIWMADGEGTLHHYLSLKNSSDFEVLQDICPHTEIS